MYSNKLEEDGRLQKDDSVIWTSKAARMEDGMHMDISMYQGHMCGEDEGSALSGIENMKATSEIPKRDRSRNVLTCYSLRLMLVWLLMGIQLHPLSPQQRKGRLPKSYLR
jgi:hypothetical protein